MTELRLQVKKFVASPTATAGVWAGVFEAEGVFLVLDLRSSPATDFARVAEAVWGLAAALKESSDSGSVESIEAVCGAMVTRAQELLGDHPENRVGLALLIVRESLVYAALAGETVAYLLRDGLPLYFGKENTAAVQGALVRTGDRLIALTATLAAALPPVRFRHEIPWESPDGKRVASQIGAAGLTADFFPLEDHPSVRWSSLGQRLQSFWQRWRSPRRRSIYVQEAPAPEWRAKPSLPTALLLILGLGFVGSVIFTLVKERERVHGKEANALLTKAEESVKAARDLVGLDSDRVFESLNLARTDLAKAEVLGLSTQRSAGLAREIEEIEAKVLKIQTVASRLFYDLAAQGSGVAAADLVATPDGLLILDSGQGLLFRLTVPAPQGQKNPVIEKFLANLPASLGIDAEEGSLLVRSASAVSVFSQIGALLATATVDSDWGVSDAKVYGSSVYLAAGAMGQILKASLAKGKLSDFTPWLRDKLTLEPGTVIALDGYIYVWSGGLLRQLAKGRETGFALQGRLQEPIQNPRDLVTWRDAQNLYILDRALPRVLKYSKSGSLLGQYFDSQWGEPRALAVSADEKKGYILSGNKIWEFDF